MISNRYKMERALVEEIMTQGIKLSNIPCMPVDQMVDELSEAYCALINDRNQVKMMPSVMLWGAPGVGKSQGVRQIARDGYIRKLI